MRVAMAEQRVLLDFLAQMVQRLNDSPAKGLLMRAVSNPDRALDGALNAAASALPWTAAGEKLEPPELAPFESTFGVLPFGLLMMEYLQQYLHTSIGEAEQARLEAVTERVVFTAPDGSLNMSCGFHESLAALDEDMTRVRQLNLQFNAKSLATILISSLSRARWVTIDAEGSWEKFVLAEMHAFHPFRGCRAVYPEELFLSLVDRLLELERGVVLASEYRAFFFPDKTAPWPPPREAVEWTLRSIRGGVVTWIWGIAAGLPHCGSGNTKSTEFLA
mmetsp:Transcript_36235/g.73713  ORF Transcript_36235/g.73713 Transcript_36235/m.73713 type:complete len:276 (-) Transcript_36235:242-1069(-)